MKENNEILEAVDREYETILSNDGAFGRWINGLWGWFHYFPYPKQKEAFLCLLMRLLDEGNVYLEEPADAKFGEKIVFGVSVWAAPHDEMIRYILQHWPKEVMDADDDKLNDFWYDIHCPRILWFDEEDGVLIGS